MDERVRPLTSCPHQVRYRFSLSLSLRQEIVQQRTQDTMQIATIVGSLVVMALTKTDATQEAISCDLECGEGRACRLQMPYCITDQCSPIPTCIPEDAECTMSCRYNEMCIFDWANDSMYCDSLCATVRCRAGYVCDVQQLNCFTTPCPPVAVCELSD